MMRVEIIAIGTELLLGQLVNTNSAWIAKQLSDYGIHCHFQSTVGDNIKNIAETINRALERADIVICTGGLGPTQDDLTKEALAQALNVPLVFDESLAVKIQQKFTARGIAMSQNNLRQAYYPQNTQTLDQHPGTAPGLYYPKGEQAIFLVPGVPSEMKVMVRQSILPLLKKRIVRSETIITETLKVCGISESAIAEKLDALNSKLDQLENPKLSFLASGINGISVRFSAKADDETTALNIIQPYSEEAKAILGTYVFGKNGDSMESALAKILQERHLTLGLLETFTGGMIASRLHQFTDPTSYFKGSIVQQHNAINAQALKVIQQNLSSNIILNIHADTIKPEENIITLTIHILIHDEYSTHTIKIPYYDHSYSMEFSVVNALNYLRLTILG